MIYFGRLHRGLELGLAIILMTIAVQVLRRVAGQIEAPLPTLPELVLIPTLCGALIGDAVASPMAEIEASSARSRMLPLAFGIGAMCLFALMLALSFGPGDPNHSWLSAVRNVFAQTGAGFISVAWFGGRGAFILPLGLGLGMAVLAESPDPPSTYALLLARDLDFAAAFLAGALLLIGCFAVVVRGPLLR